MRLDETHQLGDPRLRRVAVIGTGIAGLATAWLLSRSARVTVYEAAAYAGGHTNTIDVCVDGCSFPVDTGFLVFNAHTYPNLCALFEKLEVPVTRSEMSFGVSLGAADIEWSGSGLGTVFAQRRNLLRPSMWRMLADVLRFNRAATRMAQEGGAPDMSLGEYLRANAYSPAFREAYLLPMAAAIWSCPTRAMLDYPLATFVHFCHNHGLVRIFDRPQWMTVRGGGREYVKRITAQLSDLRLRTPVHRVVRDETGAWVGTDSGLERYDEVVFACHSDQALVILGSNASADERRLLGAIRYQPNRAIVHTDPSLLPRRKSVWSAWNYLAGEGAPDDRPVSVSYLINRLQPLPCETPVIVSLNPFREPAADKIIRHIEYAHPLFDRAAIAAQANLASIQGVRNCWFAGAWTGHGFHEDGLNSALDVVERLGASAPWPTRASVPERIAA